jgi:hypothetical protein
MLLQPDLDIFTQADIKFTGGNSWSVSNCKAAPAFQPAGLGDFPVATFMRKNAGPESPQTRRTRMSALQ